ncbi:MAG: VanZ family protein [Alphaproteobacteria bacterium]|nr:VanZ family protein [Alphaproteobacteria bacterium]MBU6471540.1 VanZ family protein [Alphaproteobacteria bacterium]MDE2014098.1 VanZ family protein [Alphaproteobacteria bacterium]MDE2072215.1 VanZ family protein [Alphaproteobacteria bacterium]MDE2350692.1 VanZ family protein [Alphaproteobacteria bacterium]
MKFSQLYAVWLFWPAVAVVAWGELSPGGGSVFHIWDKALHFTAYFGLAGIAFVALWASRAVSWRRLFWPAVGLVVLGGALEIVQGTVGRDVSVWDEVANTLGVGAGNLAGWAFVTLFGARRLVEAGPPD